MDKKKAEEALERGGELGLRFLQKSLSDGYDIADVYAACAITMDNIERVMKLMDILGPEKFDELGEILMKHEQEKLIKEAEEAMKDGE